MMNSIKQFIFNEYKIYAVLLLFLIVVSLIFVVALLWVPADSPVAVDMSPTETSKEILGSLQQLPLNPRLYFCLLVLGVVYTVGRCLQYAKFHQEINNSRSKEGKGLSISRDWWIVLKLRQRAFALHTGTHLLLFGMFTLLLGGVYLVLFILPWVQINDQILIEQRQRGVFEERFSERLKLISEGQYWLKVLDSDVDRFSETLPLIHNISNADGISITLTVDGKRVAISKDNGGSWTNSSELGLNAGERVRGAVMDGRNGVLWGDEGSVFTIQQTEGDLRIVKRELGLNAGEWVRGAVMDGKNAVLWGSGSSVFAIQQTEGDLRIVKRELGLNAGERVRGAVMDGRNGVLWGDEGSVFTIQQTEGDLKIVKKVLKLNEDERVREAVMGSGGGVLLGDRDSVFAIRHTNNGLQTIKLNLDLNDYEWVEGAVVYGGSSVVVGGDGSVFTIQRTERGLVIAKEELDLDEDERVQGSAMDGRGSVVWGDEGSVFTIQQTDGDLRIVKGKANLNAGERIRHAIMDGRNGVIWGDRGSVFATWDNGKNWIPTIMDKPHEFVLDVVSLPSKRILVIDERGDVHSLSAYPELANALNKPPAEVREIINKAPRELIDSEIGQNIIKFSGTHFSTDPSGGTGGNNLFGNDDLKLTVMRVATLTILLFLAQILVRLIQYSLRLAATWNAQADAMLISQAPRQEEFVRLISALTPIVEFGNAAKKSVRHSREE